jgi:non-ribosomal peptide synthetase-like protein
MDFPLERIEFLEQFFENAASLFPEHVAIEFEDQKYTYEKVDKLANQLASFLQEQGVRPEEKVAICLPRTWEVYLSMLGILKAGGAYIPIDPEAPGERVQFIMHDSDAKMLITSDEIMERIASQVSAFPIFNVSRDLSLLAKYPDYKPLVINRSTQDLVYIIYTSGSSGEPKGVLLEHRNVINYVLGAQTIYPLTQNDRVLQGFSVSFDASVEEIWVPFSVGATVVVGTFDIMRSGDQFASKLNELNITFLSCAPTLLSMVHEDIPSLRILIFGGEVCSNDIAHRWCKPGRTVYNTYGPTEAAVIATYAILDPDQPVTIGRPLVGYDVLVVNENLMKVAEGEEGEILIGGESVARGYLHRDDLTHEKFIETDRFDGQWKRYYRTGDLAKYNSNGELIFMGRADAQVKVRGFRVELAEIEGLLLQIEGIRAAAVALDATTQQLAAYVVVDPSANIDREAIAGLLRLKLPYYMIPSTLDVIDRLPMTTSQKIDRKKLPAPKTPLTHVQNKTIIPPVSHLEKEMVAIMAAHFKRDHISMDDHFFNDLGGHSLLAALIVSDMRKIPLFENMSVVDVYKHPVLSDLATELQTRVSNQAGKKQTAAARERPIYKPSSLRYYTFVFFQGIALIFLFFLFGIEWLGPFFVYSYYYQADNGVVHSMFTMLWMYFILMPTLSLFAIGFKWAVIGRIKPGKYPLWGSYYFRFWIVDKVINIAPINYFTGTSILNGFLRALGAKIGKDVYINTSAISAFDLLTVGDHASICTDTHLRGYTIADGYLYIGTIDIGEDCFVGTRCYIAQNSKMESNSSIDDLTLVSEGMVIPANEHWSGSPAVKKAVNGKQEHQRIWSTRNTILFFISIFLIPLLTMMAYFPGLMLITHLTYISEGVHFLWSTIGVGFSFVVLLIVIITTLKWILLGNIKEGRYRVSSLFYYKKWFFDQLMKLSLQVIGTIYTTLYLQLWFKLLGVKMGKRVEIATVEFISPDLLETGDECFLADSVSVGASHVRNGYITIAKARIGNRTFVGNSAVVSPGSKFGNDVLVGVLSKMSDDNLPAKDGTSWFGSPAVFLPQRDVNHDFSLRQTYKPTRWLFFLRYCIEFFRVTLPATFFIALAALITYVASYLQVTKSLGELFLIFPFLYLGAAILGTLIMTVFKWLIIGKYKPAKKPLWSHYVWRSELVTGVYENFLVLFFLNILTGTPFIKYPLRLLGSKIGKKPCMFTTQITEFDLVHLGDNVTVNDNCTLQTHLFEDRVMKMSYVDIDNDCSVGGMSVVLYDSKMEEKSILEPLSVLMKSETLPANHIFRGVPANPVER